MYQWEELVNSKSRSEAHLQGPPKVIGCLHYKEHLERGLNFMILSIRLRES